jgi:hypothetical protein
LLNPDGAPITCDTRDLLNLNYPLCPSTKKINYLKVR